METVQRLELDSAVCELQSLLEQSGVITEDMLEDYFLKFDAKKEVDRQGITWEFDRHRVKMEMVLRMVDSMTKLAEGMSRTLGEGRSA